MCERDRGGGGEGEGQTIIMKAGLHISLDGPNEPKVYHSRVRLVIWTFTCLHPYFSHTSVDKERNEYIFVRVRH
jgi:hypothetical protein